MGDMEKNVVYDNVKNIYDSFADSISKDIFLKRLGYNLEPSEENFIELLNAASGGRFYSENFYSIGDDKLKIPYNIFDESKTVIIYGAKKEGSSIYRLYNLNKSNNLLFCDRDYFRINSIFGVEVISPESLYLNYKDAFIIIASWTYYWEIKEQLQSNGLGNNIIETPFLQSAANIYFDDLLNLNSNEIFVDVGVFDGNSSLQFIKNRNETYKDIYMFDPDSINYDLALNNLSEKGFSNFKIFKKGLWDKKETLSFNNSGTIYGEICNEGDCTVEVDSLDNILKEENLEPPTYIKMDIEGSELKALIGAKETITKYKPKLAVSVYHKPKDIIELASYILSLVPEYKLYLRHYSLTDSETVFTQYYRGII